MTARLCDNVPEIKCWHICISGFLQPTGSRCGMLKLWLKLHQHFSDQATRVELREWNTDWDRFAEHVWQARNGVPPKVLIYAYSYGGGWGFIKLAKALMARGIHVRAAVLADPVYRSRWLLGKWRAFWPGSVITIPRNVYVVRSFYQRTNWPRGHRLVAEDPRITTIQPGTELAGVTHQYADDAEDFHRLCLTTAGEFV